MPQEVRENIAWFRSFFPHLVQPSCDVTVVEGIASYAIGFVLSVAIAAVTVKGDCGLAASVPCVPVVNDLFLR